MWLKDVGEWVGWMDAGASVLLHLTPGPPTSFGGALVPFVLLRRVTAKPRLRFPLREKLWFEGALDGEWKVSS